MRIAIGFLAPALLLVGCGGQEDGAAQDNAGAVAEAPSAAPAPMRFSPGKWRTRSELIAMEVPGMPPELAKANIGQVSNFESCMTPEKAEAPDSDFFTDSKTAKCSHEDFSLAGGRIKARMSCEDKTVPGKMVMAIDGSYTPTSYDATVTMERSDGPGGTSMKITAKTTAERIGECT